MAKMHNSNLSFKEMATNCVYEIWKMETDGTIKKEGVSTLIGAMIIDLAFKYTDDTGIDGHIDYNKLLNMCMEERLNGEN